ncbi:MAG: hypothetical protein ACRD44_12215 [Bryobacteraceae bacterium]
MDPTLWTIRASLIFYFPGLRSRLAWTAGCLLYLAHVAAAFHFHHDWSHAAAYRATARQTAQTLGVDWGGGLWFNYAFTVAWCADALWWWIAPASRARRPRWLAAALHAFLAFMWLNGAVVFASGFVRWLAIGGALLLATLFIRRTRRPR